MEIIGEHLSGDRGCAGEFAERLYLRVRHMAWLRGFLPPILDDRVRAVFFAAAGAVIKDTVGLPDLYARSLPPSVRSLRGPPRSPRAFEDFLFEIMHQEWAVPLQPHSQHRRF